jgi:hypothetical protein
MPSSNRWNPLLSTAHPTARTSRCRTPGLSLVAQSISSLALRYGRSSPFPRGDADSPAASPSPVAFSQATQVTPFTDVENKMTRRLIIMLAPRGLASTRVTRGATGPPRLPARGTSAGRLTLGVVLSGYFPNWLAESMQLYSIHVASPHPTCAGSTRCRASVM